ncbi:methyltransferase [Bradyrhizobium viridifuturi]|jgi:tRNA1(Val) A37 N6-methylase TrmN6|uniref:tRNA1(Val) (adenine(37)-N6)-methyltransferase n=2 Tax=Pseudomonadota TaxID=1224 RepID=UPI0003960220|nr:MULTISPECIES: methyltransferase [Bradyrhizobium]ERF81104.1 MAG: D-3-phosphoglycerate dehydrogenase [Bradyrhizobium sp. DFCI-1]OYU59722.1 MAG: methyltransferase [Bradyrhizobium sp. PARBB1]PSO17558.1 methyltransferase domain-containing protein [Bradyrhizobium sp. MOS004]QRI73503.1 methyltransferase [Bradyrhizobium sp. PSBB068]MBR1024432.1 methyltransferase [Bradyrhizobium viridifuturi]
MDPGSRKENASKKEFPAAEITEDGFLGGQLRLRQPKGGHRAGHDAILLAAATPARSGDRVVDLGAGVGAAGLAVARRVRGIDLVLVEIDPAMAELARNNAGANAIMAEVVILDVEADAPAFAAAGLAPDSADVVLMNPPFNDPSRHRASPDGVRERAHVATATTLANWVHAARRLLRSNGQLAMIWRADGIADVLAALDRGFGSLELLPVHADATSPAIRILVRATKGGRAPTRLHAALLLNDGAGVPNKWVQEILAGKGELPLARR